MQALNGTKATRGSAKRADRSAGIDIRIEEARAVNLNVGDAAAVTRNKHR